MAAQAEEFDVMPTLPCDVLVTLYRLLNVQDRLSAASVCRAWCAAGRDPASWARVALAPMPNASRSKRAALLLAAVQRAGDRLEELDARPWSFGYEEGSEGAAATAATDDDEDEPPYPAGDVLEELVRAAAPAYLRAVAFNASTDADAPVWSIARGGVAGSGERVGVHWPPSSGSLSGREHIYEHCGVTSRPMLMSHLPFPSALERYAALLPQRRNVTLRCDAAVASAEAAVRLLRLARREDAAVAVEVETLYVHCSATYPVDLAGEDDGESRGETAAAPPLPCFVDALPALLAAPGVRSALRHLLVDGLGPRSDDGGRSDFAVDRQAEAIFSAALAAPALATLRVGTPRHAGTARLVALAAALSGAQGPLLRLRNVTLTVREDALSAMTACHAAVLALRDVAPGVQRLFLDIALSGSEETKAEQRDVALHILREALTAPAWPELRHVQLCAEMRCEQAFAEAFAAEVDALAAQVGPRVRVRFAAYRIWMLGHARVCTGGRAPT